MRIEVKFQVAALGATVDITSDTAAALNTESGTIGDTKNFKQVTQLPVNYRGATTSPLAAIATVPSVQQDSNGSVSIGGALPSQVGYSVDGVSTSNNRQNGALPNLYPSSEILGEFKVTAFNNNAEFAQIGDVTVTTKGGGNQFHGSLFEYHQNSALDAKVYGFDTKAPKKFNTFGGSFSGPISIPKLYKGADRTFFFVDYEGNRRRTSTPLQFLVPTVDQRGGDLSSLTSDPIIDPTTGNPFPGNIIPADRISRTAQTLLANYYPLPNNTGASNANLFLQTPVPSDTNGYDNDKLTLSFGLRYTIMPPFADKNGNLGAFNYADGGMIIPDKLDPRAEFLRSINACGTGANGQGLNPTLKCVSITKASEAGLPQGLRQTYYRNLQPRLSFAYRPFKDSKTVIRGGFGIFTMTNLGQLSFNITDIASSVVRTYTNADPATGAPRYQFPAPFFAATTQEFIGSSDFYQNTPTNYRDPQSAQWNLTVERELPGDLALRVSFVGTNSYRMNLTVDLNQTPPSTQAYDPSQKPYQNWNRILSSENLGYANYQALQTELNRRLKNGLSFQASYTWAKNLANYGGDAPSGFAPEVIYGTAINDHFNLRDVRGNVAGTRRHRFLFSGLYELPFGKGKRFLSNMSPLLNGFFGGWQLSNVTLVQTGPFLTPTFSAGLVDPANINTFNRGSIMRPDRIGNGSIDSPTPDRYFDINAFTAPPANAGRIGNAGVGILVGPGTVAISGGLSKTFAVTEKVKLRFETTFTNLPNHPNFAPPAVDVSTPGTFGRTTTAQAAEGAGNRVGQVSLRLEF